MKLPRIENIRVIGISVAVMLTFLMILLGFSGMLTILGIMLLLIVPIYLTLDNFELGQDEKLVFSFFLGAGIFPSITYWIGFFISFKIAILITFLFLAATSVVIRKINFLK
jgi:apolipoprotein N-acyltransferase